MATITSITVQTPTITMTTSISMAPLVLPLAICDLQLDCLGVNPARWRSTSCNAIGVNW